MFTGLVQETGRIAGLKRLTGRNEREVTRITIAAKNVPKELKMGDSVAVSGVCLTAVQVKRKEFSADLAKETMQRTSLARLKKGTVVNLELPARPQDRLGGHIVQGHVDGTGKLVSFTRIKGRDDWRLVIEIPTSLARYVVAQGSICVEGISLTVASIEADRLEIAIIPHTLEATNLQQLQPGDLVNLEVDVLAKYLEKMVKRDAGNKLSKNELIRKGF
ncbi:MAG TPA: riboflavin synthase [Candidatus Angelobacter sp.]|nr:riboflavin synthase [Candidatus Angelobacter sp.]